MRRATALVPLALSALAACGGSNANDFPPPATGATTTASAQPTTGTVVPVVAAENVWGDIARQLGGAHAAVTSIITDPNADPHTYETNPADAAAISNARFVILNGAGYDDFASKLLAASPNSARTVISVDKVDNVTGDNPNPHLWYSPTYVKGAADAIVAQLSAADPADSSAFAANEVTFLRAYQPYLDTLATIKTRYAGTAIAYTERVPGYLVDAAGLTLGTPASFSQSVEDGDDPSPQDTAVFDSDLTGHKVKALLYNGQVVDQQTSDIEDLATTSGIPIVAVTETIPKQYADFQTWQTAQAEQLLAALGD